MERMVEGGIYNALIMNVAPTSSMFGKDVDNPKYMSERWWELFEFTCRTAKRLGMYIWFYDQIGFSGANFPGRVVQDYPEFAGQRLAASVTVAEGNTQLNAPQGAELLAAFSIPLDAEGNEIGSYERLTVVNGQAITKEGKQRVRLIYSMAHGMNYFSKEACIELLNRVHGEFERRCSHWFGDVIVGSFQDELGGMPFWGPEFAETFLKIKGYDLISRLNDLWEGDDPLQERTRRDYQEVRAILAEEAFFKPFYEWHERWGLACGFDQTGSARAGNTIDGVHFYADLMRSMRWYAIPGNDLMGNAKVHSSIANTNGRERVWLEAFHSTGWGGTLEETFDWLLPSYRNGANLYNPHGFYYSTKGGFWEWAPPSTCWRQPYWKHYKQFSDAITRMSYLMSGGTHMCDVAILYPTSATQSNYYMDRISPMHVFHGGSDGLPEESVKIQSVFEELISNLDWFNNPKQGVLDQCGQDYDIISELMLAEDAEIKGGAIKIQDLAYKTVILPHCTTITSDAAEVLVRFAEQGGQIVAVSCIPHGIDEGAEGVFLALNSLFENGTAKFIESADGLHEIFKGKQSIVEAPVPTLHRKKQGTNILFVPATPMQATENITASLIDPDQHIYEFSPNHYIRDMKIVLHLTNTDIYRMNLITGEVVPAQFTIHEEFTEILLPFEEAPVTVLLWEDGVSGLAAPTSGKQYTIVESLKDEWKYTLVATMQNRYGDFARPASEGAPMPATWFFQHKRETNGEIVTPFSNKSDWETIRATFGQQAWNITAPISDLPGAALTDNPMELLKSVQSWSPIMYSKTRGIDKDLVHVPTLGPSGRIPDDFLDFGTVLEGMGVQLRTGVWSEEQRNIHLAVHAVGCKRNIWLNGDEIKCDTANGNLTMAPITLKPGCNVLDIQFIPKATAHVRAYWTLVEDIEDFVRPIWLRTVTPSVLNKTYRFACEFELDELPVKAEVSYAGISCVYNLFINGRLYRGVDSYGNYGMVGTGNTTCQPENWRMGTNRLEFEVTPIYPIADNSEIGTPGSVYLDSVLTFADGRTLTIKTDEKWQTTDNDGKWVKAYVSDAEGINLGPVPLPAEALRVKKYPNSLPGFEWLETEKSASQAIEAQNDPFFGNRTNEWFSWKIMSAASKAHIDVAGEATLWIDGKEFPIRDGIVELPGTNRVFYEALLRVIPKLGRTGGAIFNGPVTYDTDAVGNITCGDWQELALESYSGGITYMSELTFTKIEAGKRVYLNLGAVRGTAEVSVNGKFAGARFLTPYRYDITDLINEGVNQVAVTVFNTLAPYLNAVGATRFIPKQQLVSGMLGPVTVLKEL